MVIESQSEFNSKRFNSTEMKLKAFLWGKVQAFKILDPSPAFKEKYPKNFIIVCGDLKMVYNVDNINDIPTAFWEISYMFTYVDMKSYGWRNMYFDDMWSKCMNTVPMNLHNYFTNSSDCNVIMKVLPKSLRLKDPRYIYSIVLRNNIDELKNVNFTKSFDLLLKSVYAKLPIHDTETWLEYLLDTFPLNAEGHSYEFPNVIEDKLFSKPLNPSIKSFIIGYTIREPKLEKEMSLISSLEQQLNDLSGKIIIQQNYSDLIGRVKSQAKKQKVKFKCLSNDQIQLKTSDFYKLKMKFTILDLITIY